MTRLGTSPASFASYTRLMSPPWSSTRPTTLRPGSMRSTMVCAAAAVRRSSGFVGLAPRGSSADAGQGSTTMRWATPPPLFRLQSAAGAPCHDSLAEDGRRWRKSARYSALEIPETRASLAVGRIFQVRRTRAFTSAVLLLAVPLLPLIHTRALAQEQPGASDFVKDARNPLADQISVQGQPNFNFGGAPDRDTQYIFNIQSTVPIHFAAWTLFARTILPLIDQPGSEPGQGYTFGIGDIQPTLFLSPPSSKSFIWAFGPVFQFPSASSTSLGTGKCEIGPTAAAILTGSWWQVGAQVN